MSQYDSYSKHEVLDRIHVVQQTISDHLHDHIYLEDKLEVKCMLLDILMDLQDVYSYVAETYLGEG